MSVFARSALLLALLVGSSVSMAQPRFDLTAAPTAYGLYPITGTEMGRVFARPDAGLPYFRSVYVAPVSIAYRQDRTPGGQQIDPFKLQEMSLYFQQALRTRLAETSYEVVDKPTLGTFSLKASIINLRLGAGADATSDSSPVYFDSVAEMTLVLELSNGISGELLVQVVDEGDAVRSLHEGGAVSKRETVIRLLDAWAARIATRLEQVRQLGGNLAQE